MINVIVDCGVVVAVAGVGVESGFLQKSVWIFVHQEFLVTPPTFAGGVGTTQSRGEIQRAVDKYWSEQRCFREL